MSNDSTKIAFIGAGNMATSLLAGLIQGGWKASRIMIADPNPDQRERILSRYSVLSTDKNIDTIAFADIIVLSVKPQMMRQVIEELVAASPNKLPLLISIAAGIRTENMQSWLGGNARLVRVMPNTPAIVQSGASVLFASADIDNEDRNSAESILRSVGLALWVDDESQLDAVTAISGSGPAYLFLVMEALQAAGEKLGLPKKIATLLAIETAFGASKMALEREDPPALLRQQVTSPGGTTERALEVLAHGNFKELLIDAVCAAEERSKELANLLGAQ